MSIDQLNATKAAAQMKSYRVKGNLGVQRATHDLQRLSKKATSLSSSTASRSSCNPISISQYYYAAGKTHRSVLRLLSTWLVKLTFHSEPRLLLHYLSTSSGKNNDEIQNVSMNNMQFCNRHQEHPCQGRDRRNSENVKAQYAR